MFPLTSIFIAVIVLVTPAADVMIGVTDQGRRIDEYGALNFSQEKVHLDVLAKMLKNEVDAKGFIVLYEGSNFSVTNGKTRVCRSLHYLLSKRKTMPGSLVGAIVSGGHRKTLTVELWIFPKDVSDYFPFAREEDLHIIRAGELERRCQT